MKSGFRSPSNVPPVVWASVLFGVLVYLILPGRVVVLNDDFGYLRSVLETVQRGRPWTDDWLEPWSASLSVLSALIFKITGSFHAATCGLQAIFAGAAFAGIYALMRERRFSQRAAVVVGGVVLLCPTLLWKQLEYTGVALYLPCFLWAMWAAGKNRWGLFFVFWALAFASRQSAVTWLALPGFALLRAWVEPSSAKKIRLDLIGLLAAAVGVFALLSLGMNKAHSQAVITDHLFDRVDVERMMRFLVTGLVAGFGFVGIGAFLLNWRTKGIAVARRAPWEMAVILAVSLLVIVKMAGRQVVQLEHGSYEGETGLLYVLLLWTAAIAGWLMNRFSVRWDMVLAAFLSLLLVGVRSDVWDYYYMDVAIFSLFSVAAVDTAPGEEGSRWPVMASWSVSALFAVLSVFFVFEFKMSIDRREALCVIGEKALRNKDIEVTELDQMPFGFIGWHLHPHYVQHQGKGDPHIAGFTRYLRPGAIEARMSRVRFWRDSKSLSPVEPSKDSVVLATEVFSVGWFRWQRCTLLRSNGPAAAPEFRLERDRYERRPFPLNDAEWRELAAKPAQSVR